MEQRPEPSAVLREGSKILAPTLEPHGFAFQLELHGTGSGGSFATGNFRRGDRWLELHFRHSLGMVSYHLRDAEVTHEVYMRALLGSPFASHYPGFSDDPLDGFRHLRLDLEMNGNVFLRGSDAHFLRAVRNALDLAEHPWPSGPPR